jgi:ABC-2 type transport system permease protein
MTVALAEVRRGPGYWRRGYTMMLRFDALSLREILPFFVIIQTLMGAGMAIIYGFYFDDLPPAAATFIATGAPTLAIIPVGMTLVPIVVAQHKWDQTYDFLYGIRPTTSCGRCRSPAWRPPCRTRRPSRCSPCRGSR